MKSALIFLCAICAWYPVQGTYPSSQCTCNGKALYCVRDSLGLRCANCQGNTEGRHCESCKEGYYHQRAGERCLPCYCNPLGSEGPGCDSQGQCLCKRDVQGTQCDRCTNGSSIPLTGCEPQQKKSCFCNGHSNECSPAQGYSVYNIISTFDQGMAGWRVITSPTVSPPQVQFRWSPTHHSVEVSSSDVLPVYLSAPAQYLGNQALSYGQTLSFVLRLNRGVRYPSTSDVVLEGAGLQVSAALGNMRTVIPCGKKITYTFRLDEQPNSRWKPQLSAPEFQALLSNLTAIKIRVTFGEGGHGYLDDVTLVSARLGPGFPASWVEKCHCPTGYEGQFCEHCAAGYKRRFPGQGVRSQCEPCACRGGSCDPETGDCYSADETPSGQGCATGYYSDPQIPGDCKKCPCPLGYICSLTAGTLNVKCRCPPGATGSRCQKCSDGFYGDPLGESGIQRPCQRCHCNGHLDLNAVGNCDRLTGECLKCLNNTTGFQCEKCMDGFFHSKDGDACHACNCNPKGSIASSCSEQGQCKCKEGFEGQKCVRSTCPSCFNPVKSQIRKYVKKLQQVEALFNEVGTGGVDITRAMEKAISTAEEMVKTVESDADTLIEAEKSLHAQLVAIGNNQLRDERKIQDISKTIQNVVWQEQQYRREVADIQELISDIRQNLQKAKRDIQSIELPSGDAAPGTNIGSNLVQKANDLAENHTGEAAKVEQTAKRSLLEAENALALMRTVINGENKVTEQLNGLRTQYEIDKALVNTMNKQAAHLSNEAAAESTVALETLKQISDLEKNIPKAPKDINSLVATLDGLKNSFGSNVSGFVELTNQAEADQTEAVELMNQLRNAKQVQDNLFARANIAKADADKALKLFNNLGSVDQALEKLKGFEAQINKSKSLADDALSKLPIISDIIGKAVVNNDKTQAILDQLGDYDDTLATLNKLNMTLANVEGMSGSLPSSDLLKTATTLKGGLEVLNNQADATRKKLTEEKTNAERERELAEKVNWEASGAYINANNTKGAVGDALKTVNNLLELLGSPEAVDEKKVTDLENAIATSRKRVETELKPRLKELEDKEVQQRAAFTRMISDIETILADISNLEEINKTIPSGCFNTPPIERA
ncbi:laminin subunit gamma-2 [Neoarius graeffei]|uniref:laminin subunit gamma-2 n=1 Tax=Neoarius graeffei TaxID=443677 RepID=UPI00298D0684|nr:laminin subunit gamma-2 [Neoarius graeffei]